ncbi:MAG: hypothetical protein II089_08340 [Selenomonas sp.]|nr:hypothetical protein [Selenomonas sp.]
MVKIARKLGVNILICLFMLSATVLAAGKVIDEDFSCQGVMLGDSESVLQSKWGEPLYDKTAIKQGVTIKTYVYKNGYEASVSPKTGMVVDFVVDMEKYEARDGVRKGATKYWLEKVYGKQQRQYIEGNCYLIFNRPGFPHQHLMLLIDPEDGQLRELKITALPVNDAEAEAMEAEGDPLLREDEGRDNNAMLSIDTSALPQDKEVRWGGLRR